MGRPDTSACIQLLIKYLVAKVLGNIRAKVGVRNRG